MEPLQMESHPTEDILTDLANPPARTAGIGIRFAAAFIDNLIISVIGLVMGMFWGDNSNRTTDDDGFGFNLTGLPAFVLFGIAFALVPIMEGLKSQTIGKQLCRIKVIKDDGSASGVGQSILRHFFDVIDCFLLIGIFVSLSNKKRRRIGDLVAGTRVVMS